MNSSLSLSETSLTHGPDRASTPTHGPNKGSPLTHGTDEEAFPLTHGDSSLTNGTEEASPHGAHSLTAQVKLPLSHNDNHAPVM